MDTYWKPVWKTDVADAEWIEKLLRYGLLIEKSFVPPSDIRELCDLTRLRKKIN
ncbi:TPA: hypothetical protein RMI67_006162 [Bacillus cereus]|nr:hypothetical protein [Bacillus cereus]